MNVNCMAQPEPASLPSKMPSVASDAQLLAEVTQGNLDRFDVLVDRYKVRLASYIRHRVPDLHHAEDLAQETFLRMFRAARADMYSGRASVATWLFTIADNCVTDYLRAAGRRPLALETDADVRADSPSSGVLDIKPAEGSDPMEAASHHESQLRADALLAPLPDDQRRVVALKVLGGLTLGEVAEVLGCPVGTVKSRLFYGLRKIEESLVRSGRLQP
jgi:RNA polymerase sigma-70 factor (ECF subfamily)